LPVGSARRRIGAIGAFIRFMAVGAGNARAAALKNAHSRATAGLARSPQ
jgi:hypothetical protein